MDHVDHVATNWGGGIMEIGEHTWIHPLAQINVTERLVIGDYGTVHEKCVIEGRDIEIGQELWMLPGAIIGGGSRYERQSSLRAGHYLHLGRDTFINTARPVVLGNEVGLGTGTKLYTHGAYLSALDGFPVTFGPITLGDRVWLPGATVNPGVTIGSDVVVGVGSVVLHDIPAGSLAAGVPARIIRENAYPAKVDKDCFWDDFWANYPDAPLGGRWDDPILKVGGTAFDVEAQRITGPATDTTERLRDQLRRYGIRFYSRPVDGVYRDWA